MFIFSLAIVVFIIGFFIYNHIIKLTKLIKHSQNNNMDSRFFLHL